MSGKITVSSHPDAEQLRAFQSGTLTEEQIAEVEAHLQSCVACCDVLSGLPEDGFLLRVRRACKSAPTLLQQGLSSTPPPPDTVTLPDTPLETTASDAPSLPGYEDVRELGRGGMGVVYAATHVVMGRRVAIKILHPEFSCNPVAVERFRREVRAAARLAHPNIVTAHDANEDGGRSFLVMEYVDGESLGDHLHCHGPLPVAEACHAVRQAALGVQHAHDNGLIHRDLKPHNLMRTADGTVKVCDFGLAALIDDRGPASSTAPNAIMGTPDYMAPEQAENARAADGRADVYALACTLYHLLTGQVPFPEESVLLKFVAHRTQTRPSASRLRPEIPAELDGVLRRAMARKPANRYQTPGDFANALEPFADPAQRPARRQGRKRLLALAALMLSLGVAIVGVVRLPTGKDQDVVIQTNDSEVEPEQPGEVLRWSQGYKFVHRIAVSPDGRFAWTAGDDFSKWDLRTGARLEQIGADNTLGEEALPSPDGKMLLLVKSDSCGAHLYDAATLKLMRSLLGSPQSPMQAVWLPDGRLLTGGNDFIARLWDARTGKAIREFRGHTTSVDFVDANRDGTRILTFSSREGTLRVWNPDDGKELWSLSGQTGLALFAPDGKSMLIGGPDGVIRRIAYPSGTILRSFRTPDRRPVTWDRLCLMPDGRHFLSAGSDRVLRLWDLQTGRELYQAAHPGQAIAIAVTPDGRHALLGTDFGSVLKWRLPPLRQGGEALTEKSEHAEKVGEVRIFGGGVGRIARAHFLPDGERVLASGDSLSLWNTRTGEKIREFTGEVRGWSLPVNISRDGRYALVAFHLLDLKTGEKVCTLEGGEDSRIPLWGVAFSPDGSRAVLGSEVGRHTGTLWVADLKTGKSWKCYDTEHKVRSVAYSPDGTRIAAGLAGSKAGASNLLRVYKVETGEILHSFKVPSDAGYVAFSPDGNQLVSAHGPILCLWDLKLGKQLKRFEGHTGFIEDVVFTPDGQHIVSAGWDATVHVWSLARGEAIACFRGHREGILGVSVSADGLHAVSGSGDRTLRLWRLPSSRMGEEEAAEPSGQLQVPRLVETRRHVLPLVEKGATLPHTYAAAFSPDGTMYAVGGDDGLIRIWSRRTGQLLHILRGHNHWIGRIAFTPDGKRLVSSGGSTLRVWDTATGRELQKLPVPTEGAGCVDIAPDGKHLVANCLDNTVRIWNLESAREVRCLKVGHPCDTLFVADGQRIVTWNREDTLKLWDAATGALLATESGPPLSAKDVRTARGGKMLLVAGRDGLSWRDPATLREVRSLKRRGLFEDRNWAVSPDGRFMIVASEDEAGARLWDLEAGKEIDQLELSSRPSMQIAFAPDGRHIAAGSFRGFAYLLRIEEGAAKAGP